VTFGIVSFAKGDFEGMGQEPNRNSLPAIRARTIGRGVALIGVALLSHPATAASVYLECDAVGYGGHTRHLRIALNESEGAAQMLVVETGYTQTRPAMFTPTEVTWAAPTAGFQQHMVVNRATLAFSSHMDGIGDADEHGQCVMPQTDPNRKF
jgi:hypothetical protein